MKTFKITIKISQTLETKQLAKDEAEAIHKVLDDLRDTWPEEGFVLDSISAIEDN